MTDPMTPRAIFAAIQKAESPHPQSAEAQALLALRDLLVGFIDATDGPNGYPDSMASMSMDQIRFLNLLHLAVGL